MPGEGCRIVITCILALFQKKAAHKTQPAHRQEHFNLIAYSGLQHCEEPCCRHLEERQPDLDGILAHQMADIYAPW